MDKNKAQGDSRCQTSKYQHRREIAKKTHPPTPTKYERIVSITWAYNMIIYFSFGFLM